MNRRQTGITLIELMIVVVIVGILAAIAYPSYTNYVEQGRRSDAQSDLVELANFMERYYSNHGSYEDASGNAPTLPFAETPRDASGSSVFYDITVATGNSGQSYTLTATPKNAQTSDSCGTLTLSQTGNKTPADCW